MEHFHYKFNRSNQLPDQEVLNGSPEVEVLNRAEENIELETPRDKSQALNGDNSFLGISRYKVVLILFLNVFVWGVSYLYLKRAAPVYETSWGIIVLGEGESRAEVQLPDAGRASASSSGSRIKSFEDARVDYVFLAKSPEVLQKAANIANIDIDEFDEPDITADDGSAVISFTQTAPSPELVHQKSLALYRALSDYLEELRQSYLYQKTSQNTRLLQQARNKVEDAQSQLASYQARSSFESDDQITRLVASIEELRRLQSQNIAQAEGLEQRVNSLSRENDFVDQDASDAYKLQGDPLYQQLISEYGRLKSELSIRSAELAPSHPQVIQAREELRNTESALQERSFQILGRSKSLDFLNQSKALISDPQVNVVYEDFFRQTTTNRADRQSVLSEGQQLGNEISEMQTRLSKLNQEKITVDRLKRELQVSEAVLASKVASLELNETNIFSAYPPIELIVKPTIPDIDSPIAPNLRMLLLAALAGSFLVTSGVLLLGQGKEERMRESDFMQEEVIQ